MLSNYLKIGLRFVLSRGLLVAGSLMAGFCSFAQDEKAESKPEIPLASVSVLPASDGEGEMLASIRRLQKASGALQVYRNAVLATNEVMAALLVEARGKGEEAEAARVKIMEMVEADPVGKAWEAAYAAELEVHRAIRMKGPQGEAVESSLGTGEKLKPQGAGASPRPGRVLNNRLRPTTLDADTGDVK